MKKLLQILLAGIILLSATPIYAQKISKKSKAKHIVLIGLDGWGAFSFEKADMPNVKKLKSEGSYSLNTRSVLPSSSAVNWASMFMGAGPELHGFTDWGSKTPDLPSRITTQYGLFPTIFGLLRDQADKSQIGYFYEWEGMKYLTETQAMNETGHIKPTDEDHKELTERSIRYIKENKPNLTAVIFDQPDGKGHKIGFGSAEYYNKLNILDQRVGEIINAIKEAGIEKETIIMIVADHGGKDTKHGGKTMQEMEIPLIFAGKGIKKNHEIAASTMIYDIAPTIAYIFNLNQPQVWTGRAITEVFGK
ncbi:MAG: alkaline phosphatase [Bacteroidales bacterium]